MKKILLTLLFLIIISCSDKQKEAQLMDEISQLKSKLDNCLNGAEKLHSKFFFYYEKKNYDSCKRYYKVMLDRHSDSELFKEVDAVNKKIIIAEEEEQKARRLIAEEQEKKRLKAIADKEKEKRKSLKKLKKKFDDVSQITWYRQPYFTHYNNRNLTSLYMGATDSSRWLRLKMSYKGENWIFFEKAYLSYDGNTLEIPFDKYKDKTTDNSSGYVWEWIDVSITFDQIFFLKKLAKAKKAKMRLSGKYTETRLLTGNEKRGIIDIINAYELLNKN